MSVRILIPATGSQAVLRYFLLTIGIACLGFYGYSYVERALYQSYESREFDRTPNRRVANSAAFGDTNAPIGRPARKSAPRAGRMSPATVIGRLSIPRLHFSAMVREGTDRNTLQRAIGHIPATALPGQAGNIGVAGHRDTFFSGLKDLKARDEIQFATLDGDFKYVVESFLIVDPDDVGILASSPDNVLTLVTCYPFYYIGSAPKRFVVRARQVSPQTAPVSTVE
jgi:sortase A